MAVEYDGRDRPRVSLAELREQLELEIAKGRVEGQASASIFGRLCAASDEVVSGELGVSPRTDPVGYALAQIEVLQVRAAAIQKLGVPLLSWGRCTSTCEKH